jgi:hypothetical protein
MVQLLKGTQMKSLFNGKTWTVLLAFAALLGLVVLASGLGGMKFDQPRMVLLENFFRLSDTIDPNDAPAFSWARYLLIGMLIALFLLMLGPIRPQTGRSLISQLLRFFGFTFILMLILSRMAQNNSLLFDAEQSLTPMPGSNGQPGLFIQPEVSSQWEFLITSLIVIVIGAVAVVILNRIIDRWLHSKTGLDEIAEIARSTLNDFSKSKESRNAIIRCYTRMSTVVNEHRGITREVAMTPAEFAERLENAGLPGEAVHGLTSVFEKVRYGGQNVNAEEIKDAKNCLAGILKACETKW